MFQSYIFIQSLLKTRVFLSNTPDVKGKVLEISTVEDFENDALINMYIQKNQITSIVVSAPIEVIPKKPYFKYMTYVDFASPSTKKLGDSLFEGNTNIKKVQILASVKELGKRCFYASGIEDIVLNYITTFGDECFAYAPRIESMSIGATQIPKSFAQNAIGLRTLEFINEGVSINTSAFSYCINLTTIPFTKIAVYGEQSFEYSGLTEFRFTKNTKKMLASAFRYSNINNIVFDPDYNQGVSVSVRQFMGTLVTKINFSKIDATSCLFMFAECQLLEEIYMDPRYVKVPAFFCDNCHNLKKYTSIGAETVEEKAFYNCRSLKECNLPKAKTFFPKSFQFCEQVELDLSAAKDIQGYAFGYCHKINITNMKYTGKLGDYAFIGCRGIEELVINCTLGSGSFQGCINLKKVTFGKNCELLNTMSFSNCTSLKEINLNGFITTIEDAVFTNSSEIEVLNLTGVKSIMFYAFENSKVKSVILGDTEMMRSVFHNCFNLNKVIIGKDCKQFYPAAFAGIEENIEFVVDKDNKDITLKDGIMTRNDGTLLAILPSYSSKTYTVPDSISSFAKHSFILAKNVERLEINHFMTMNQQNFSYYLKELVINNQDNENRSIILESFHLSGLQKVTLINGVKLIDYYSFYQCYNLTDVTLNDGVLLREGVFVECTKLEKIKLPDSRVTLQDFVEGTALFMHCTSLKSVDIPSHMTYLYELMFANTGLEEYIVPDQITSIGKYCFEGCKKLKKLVLGKGIMSLGKYLTYFVDDNLTLELSKNVRYIDPEAFVFTNNIEVVIDGENPYYFVERNAVIERSSKTLITTFGKLPEIYRVPSSVEIVAEDAIKYINDYYKSKEFMKFSNERPAMVVILPETIKEFRNPTNLWTTITVCYEGEYFQSTKITNIPNKYADKKKYLNPSMFGENVKYDCSQKLPDNWRHIIGKTSLEKNLILSTSILAGLAGAAFIACIILYTLKSRTH